MEFRRRAKAHYRSMQLLDSAPLRQVHRILPSTVVSVLSRPCEISNDAKAAFLPLSRNTSDSGEKLMDELSRIDPWAAQQVGLRSVAVQNFVMRLWYESSSSQDAPQQEGSSYIILSYTWHDPSQWSRHPSLGCPSNDTESTLPLSPAMWSAFLLQRRSPSEGLWCDQICIDQASIPEKTLAIGAMDLLYKNARKVVVALEDIAITKTEMDTLFRISLDFSPSQQEGGRIATAFESIIHARWFRRAWCMHEFLVSRNHTFLVPVSDLGGDGVGTILGLDALFLAIMADYFGRSEYLGYLSKQYTLLATPDEDINLIHSFVMRVKLLSMIEANEPELFYSRYGTYTGMQTFSEVFSLGAKVMADKLSILLNVMNSGLYYTGSESLAEEDCLRLATVVVLATGDPEALTTTGGPAHSPHSKPGMRWLRWPILTGTAPQLGSDPHLPKIGTDLAVTEEGLQLDMQFLCTSADIASAERRYLSIARLVIDHRANMSGLMKSSSDPESAMRQDHEAIRLYSIQALACALHLGQDWIHQVHNRLHLPADIQGQHRNYRLIVLKRAVDWALSLDYEQENILLPESEDLFYNENILNLLHENIHSLLQFADRLCFTGPAVTSNKSCRVAAYADTDFAVQILDCSSMGVPDPFLVFAPVYDQSNPDSLRLTLCMPKVLANEEYRELSRIWILKKCRRASTRNSFELVSKTKLIGPKGVPKGRRMGKVVIC